MLKANQKVDRLQKRAKKKNQKKEEKKKHYIKWNGIYSWARTDWFSICQRLSINIKGPEKKSILAWFAFISSLVGQIKFHNFGKT